ncbi:MAG: flagellar brake protein [Gammaproteobacteria bacterium]|nr:flagellar brake protein [Gammaproteobacteria bacterium]
MLHRLSDLEVIDGAVTVDEAPVIGHADARHILLKKVFERHCLLELRFKRDAEAYQTAIVELMPAAGYMVLDALTPHDGDEQAAALPGIRVRTRLNRMDLKFASVIVQRGIVDSLPFYKVPYPVVIDYPQRRSEHRVTVPLDRCVVVRIHGGDGAAIRGEVRDLCPSGFSARLLIGDVNVFQPDDARNATCEIELPGNGIVKAAIEICHIFPSRGRAAPRVGVRFLDLAPRSERQIERWVARLEREHNRLR